MHVCKIIDEFVAEAEKAPPLVQYVATVVAVMLQNWVGLFGEAIVAVWEVIIWGQS